MITALPNAPITIDLDLLGPGEFERQSHEWHKAYEDTTQKHLAGQHDQKLHGRWANDIREKLKSWKSGLTEAESQALYEWGSTSRNIRDVETGKNTDPGMVEITKNFQSALDKGVKIDDTVYRGLSDVPAEMVFGWLQKGEITTNSHQSATLSKVFADENYSIGYGGVLLEIKQNSGTYIGDATRITKWSSGADDYVLTDEQEVVLPKDQVYKITGVRVKPSGKKNTVDFSEWLAGEVAYNMSQEAEKIHRRRFGADRYEFHPGAQFNKYTLESDNWRSPASKRALAESEKFYKTKKTLLIKQIKSGKMPPSRFMPKILPELRIGLEET